MAVVDYWREILIGVLLVAMLIQNLPFLKKRKYSERSKDLDKFVHNVRKEMRVKFADMKGVLRDIDLILAEIPKLKYEIREDKHKERREERPGEESVRETYHY